MQAVANSGKAIKTVLVLVEARPRIIPEELISATSAVILAYLPGPCKILGSLQFFSALADSIIALDAGVPLAEVLFGKTNPSGKLPFTYPRTTGDILVPYWHWYSDSDSTNPVATNPLYWFGHGLSYTGTVVFPPSKKIINAKMVLEFTYDNLRLSTTTIAPGESLSMSFRVTNTGKFPGKEVLELYVSDIFATVAPSVKVELWILLTPVDQLLLIQKL